MDNGELPPEVVRIYQCAICQTYFENYSTATVHLALKHELKSLFSRPSVVTSLMKKQRNKAINSKKLKNGNKACPSSHKKNDSVPTSLILVQDFRQLSISIERWTRPEVTSSPKDYTQTLKKPHIQKSVSSVQDGSVEIKLDTLKASEIEALLSNLFSQPSTSKVTLAAKSQRPKTPVNQIPMEGECSSFANQKNIKGLHRNNRSPAVRPLFKEIDDDEQNSDDEVVETRMKRRVTKARTSDLLESDDSFVENDDNDSSDSDSDNTKKKPQRKKNGRRRQSKRKGGRCYVCSINFGVRNEYVEHMIKNHRNEETQTYFCHHCGKICPYIHSFSRHLKAHEKRIDISPKNETLSLTCQHCNKMFHFPATLAKHLAWHNKRMNAPGAHECPICHHRFADKHHIQRHMTLHLENNPFVCKFPGCNKKFNGDYNLRRHILLHTSREEHMCPHCKCKYSRKDKLKSHITRYHSSNSTEKVQFRKRYVYVESAEGNLSNDDVLALTNVFVSGPMDKLKTTIPILTTSNKDAVVDDDAYSDTESIHLTDHILVKEEDDIHIKGEILSPKKGESNEKNEFDTTETDKESDISKHLPKPNQPIHPKKLFEMSNALRFNFGQDPVIQKLLAEKPEVAKDIFPPYLNNRNGRYGDFKCKQCPWTGPRQWVLEQHMKKWHNESFPVLPVVSETEQMSVLCGTCGYSAKSGEELKLHIDWEHVKDRKYNCSFCSMRFREQRKQMEHEKRVHLTEKRYKCLQCFKKFATKGTLNIHKHTHQISNKVYKCDACGKELKTSKGLSQHRKLHTDDRALSTCKICSQICAGIHSLKRHIRYVHMKVPNPYKKYKKSQPATSTIPNTNTTAQEKERGTEEIENDQVTHGKSPLSNTNDDNDDALLLGL